MSAAGRLRSAYAVHSSSVSVILLVVSNLIPLLGVAFLGWSLLLILALYWAENAIVGVINVPKILLARGTGQTATRWQMNGLPLTRVGTAAFFCFHYGFFWVIHGVFVLTFIPVMTGTPYLGVADVPILAVGTLGLGISHGVSFWTNYLGRREYLVLSPSVVATQPYSRLVVLHLTIILGAFVSILFGTPLGSLLVLVVLKTALDLYFHLRQHRTILGGRPGPALDQPA